MTDDYYLSRRTPKKKFEHRTHRQRGMPRCFFYAKNSFSVQIRRKVFSCSCFFPSILMTSPIALRKNPICLTITTYCVIFSLLLWCKVGQLFFFFIIFKKWPESVILSWPRKPRRVVAHRGHRRALRTRSAVPLWLHRPPNRLPRLPEHPLGIGRHPGPRRSPRRSPPQPRPIRSHHATPRSLWKKLKPLGAPWLENWGVVRCSGSYTRPRDRCRAPSTRATCTSMSTKPRYKSVINYHYLDENWFFKHKK